MIQYIVMTDTFKKQLGIQLGIGLGVLVLAVLITQLVVGDLAGNSTKIQNQKTELALRIQATDQLASLKSDFEKAQPLFQFLNSVLPPKDSLINFGQDLISLGRVDRLELNFSFGGETAASDQTPGFINFAISGTGAYGNFQKFLADLEKSRYFIKFNSLDLTRQQSGDNYGILAEGQVFYQ